MTMQKSNYRGKVIGGIIVAIVSCLLLGAGNVATAMKQQDKATQRTRSQVAYWHQQIAAELPVEQQEAWLRAGLDYPLELLQACASEVSAPSRTR